jgi:putative ABC transport system permease protein
VSYALTILWHERRRFLPAVVAVAFSALLVALQCGLLLGTFAFASAPVDHTRADVWVGGRGAFSVDRGYPIPDRYLARLAAQPGVRRCEVYVQGFTYWSKPDGGAELAMVIGSRLGEDALGAIGELTPELRGLLAEPGTVVVDEPEMGRLGVRGAGDRAEVGGRRVRVVGLVRAVKSLWGAYVFCSVPTARAILGLSGDQATWLLGRCGSAAEAAAAARLREGPDLAVFTSEELSLRSRLHWLTRTKAGIGLGYAAALGLLVGAVVTSQTLYAAVAASLREYAVLRALGIPRWRLGSLVLAQSFWVGAAGVVLALPPTFALERAADWLGVGVLLPPLAAVLRRRGNAGHGGPVRPAGAAAPAADRAGRPAPLLIGEVRKTVHRL